MPRAASIALCAALALLELAHPTWPDGAVAQAVNAAGGTWLPLHAALIVAYGLLTWRLWVSVRQPPPILARLALALFAMANTAFLAVDGVVVGLGAAREPVGVDQLWASLPVTLLADLTGATWCLALLSLDAARVAGGLDRPFVGLLALTWLAFIAGATALPGPALLARGLAIAAAVWLVYHRGTRGLANGLLTFGAVLRQHVGPEAALGLLCVAAALALPDRRR